MTSFRVANTAVLNLVQAESSLEPFVNERSAAVADLPFNQRREMVQRIAELLDLRIAQFAEKYQDYDLIVDSIGKRLVVGTSLWHPVFLCRDYIVAVLDAIESAGASKAFVVTNRFEFYGDATAWDFDFTELTFDFAVTLDIIAVAGMIVDDFVELVNRSGAFALSQDSDEQVDKPEPPTESDAN